VAKLAPVATLSTPLSDADTSPYDFATWRTDAALSCDVATPTMPESAMPGAK
jgi:hypothetical protein